MLLAVGTVGGRHGDVGGFACSCQPLPCFVRRVRPVCRVNDALSVLQSPQFAHDQCLVLSVLARDSESEDHVREESVFRVCQNVVDDQHLPRKRLSVLTI